MAGGVIDLILTFTPNTIKGVRDCNEGNPNAAITWLGADRKKQNFQLM